MMVAKSLIALLFNSFLLRDGILTFRGNLEAKKRGESCRDVGGNLLNAFFERVQIMS